MLHASSTTRREAQTMLYVGLDLSRKRLDWLALTADGQAEAFGAVAPDRDGLSGLARRLGDEGVLAVIESMSGARFVHDQLELAGWDVRIADAVKARGLAPLACKTDKIDCWALAFTIASEIGDSGRFASPGKLTGYTGLCPRVDQSGERDRRGPLRKNGPNYLRWALIEAAHTAGRHPHYRPLVERMRERHGRNRGSKIAAIEIGRRLTEAIWYMLTTNTPFAPAGATHLLAA